MKLLFNIYNYLAAYKRYLELKLGIAKYVTLSDKELNKLFECDLWNNKDKSNFY